MRASKWKTQWIGCLINKDNTAEDREVLGCSYVLSKAALHNKHDFLRMTRFAYIFPCKAPLLFGCHHIDHLTANGACFSCCKIAVVAVLEVNAYFACCFHLESFESFSALSCKIRIVHFIISFNLSDLFDWVCNSIICCAEPNIIENFCLQCYSMAKEFFDAVFFIMPSLS